MAGCWPWSQFIHIVCVDFSGNTGLLIASDASFSDLDQISW